MFWSIPRADSRARLSVASSDPGPWLLLLLSPLSAFLPGASSHAGHSTLFLVTTFGLLAGLHGLLLLSWRTRHPAAAALEPLTPFATLFILAVTIASSGTRFPVLWVPIYFYAPALAHLYQRTGWFALGFLATGTFVAAVEFAFRVSGTPNATLIANALLPPIFYLFLSVDPERERRAQAAIVAHGEILERARAEERRLALARDVHDGIGAHLTAAAIQAEVATDTQLDEPVRARAALARLRHRIAQAMDELALLTEERAPTTWHVLATELEQIADGVAPPCALQRSFEVATPERAVTPAAGLAFRRALQEGIANAIRHGKAQLIRVELRVDDVQATLSIADDGVGMTGAAEGFGRRGIVARMKSAGGEARWEARPTGGTVLSLVLPLGPVVAGQVAA